MTGGPDHERSERGTGGDTAKWPLGTVVASAVEGVRTLLRKHFELAKLEVGAAVSVRATGVGMMLVAGVLAMFAFGFVAAAGAAALALVLPVWAAILIRGRPAPRDRGGAGAGWAVRHPNGAPDRGADPRRP